MRCPPTRRGFRQVSWTSRRGPPTSRAPTASTVREDAARLRRSDVPILRGDVTKARKAVGWQPEILFEQTLRDVLGYGRQRVP